MEEEWRKALTEATSFVYHDAQLTEKLASQSWSCFSALINYYTFLNAHEDDLVASYARSSVKAIKEFKENCEQHSIDVDHRMELILKAFKANVEDKIQAEVIFKGAKNYPDSFIEEATRHDIQPVYKEVNN